MRPPKAGDVARFSILGISLGYKRTEPLSWLQRIEQRLGEATIVERGDGAAGRAQLCYQSPYRGKVKLIFEEGVFDSFFLFNDGRKWKGVEYCAKSLAVTRTMATEGGLRLGLTERETESILGGPTYVDGAKRWYTFKTHRYVHTGIPGEIEDWEISGTVMLAFSKHRLIYLAVWRSEVS